MTKLRTPVEIRKAVAEREIHSRGEVENIINIIAFTQRETLAAVAAMLDAMADEQHTMALVIAAEKVRAMIEETDK